MVAVESRSVTREHWVQVGVTVLAMFPAVIIAVWVLSGQMAAMSHQIDAFGPRLDKDEAAISVLQGKANNIDVLQERMSGLERTVTENHVEESGFRTEQRAKLDQIQTIVNDVRLQVGLPKERR